MQPSTAAVADSADVAAYLLTRMPATYAAIAHVLGEVAERAPEFVPQSLLDAGAGPGTASWATAEAFPTIEASTLLDHNAGFLRLGAQLGAVGPPALQNAEWVAGDLSASRLGERQFDIVVAAYSLTELPDARIVEAALGLWARCAGTLVIVEPGRTRDYERLMDVRAALLAAGARMVAPCPHESACPLPKGDWCHFSVRLPRSRAHRQAKGGTLGYEDEKFSYLVVARPEIAMQPTTARIIKQPVTKKFGVELPLCTPEGLETRLIRKQDAAAFKAVRKLDWGDSLS
jgi:ribosomal protein RSM22 (predicted rRNA methylase)